MKKCRTRDITETNKLIYAVAIIVTGIVGMIKLRNRKGEAMVETKTGKTQGETGAQRA